MNMIAMLPETAPFAPEERLLLQDIIARSSLEQRHWLSGFLVGSAGPVVAPAAAAVERKPLTILFATESGNAEALAQQARKTAARLGFAAKVLDAAAATPALLAGAGTLLAIVSTWGEGDPPQRAIDLFAALGAGDAARLDGLRFGVLALGDRAYAQFCAAGRWLDERLAALGGERVAGLLECDLDYEAAAGAWLAETLGGLAPAVPAGIAPVPAAAAVLEPWSRQRPFAARIGEHVRLSGSRSGADTWHIELDLAGAGIGYEPGDALAVLPENDPALVEAVLDAAGLAGDDALAAALRHSCDITTLTAPQIAAHAALTGDARLADEPGWREGRQLLDLLEAMPHRLTGEQLTGLLRPLPPRSYSVASSRKAVGEAAHLLVAALRYETHGVARRGVASVGLTARRRTGDTVPVFLKPNPHFRLPADPHRPVVMIGPGTGVAPFRAFLQEREAVAAPGRTWLVFGHRNYTHDFLYQRDWQDLLKAGVLTRLDVAFSRDQPEKRYVQHALWEARGDLASWVADGAALYVCGDANGMARDVHEVLGRVLQAETGRDGLAALDALRREGRYLRDVY